MIRYIDDFLNTITMYKVVLYGLICLSLIALGLSFFDQIFFTESQLLISAAIFIITCYLSNLGFSFLFKAPRNTESALITAFILFLIVNPTMTQMDAFQQITIGILAMASKYLLAIHRKHIFNPAAIAVVLAAIVKFGFISWWVASAKLFPAIAIVGFLVLRKIRRFQLFFAFLLVSLPMLFVQNPTFITDPLSSLKTLFISWPILFLGSIMLTEPLTTPPTRTLQWMYGGLVGFLVSLQFELGPIYSTPELALILGNVFSYVISPKYKLFLNLKHKKIIAKEMYQFIFETNKKIHFKPGQYFEWTLPHKHPDSRGNRRYFTIASSPTEDTIQLGVRICKSSSSYKRALADMQKGDLIIANQLSGDFVLPKNIKEKLVFIAGGVGVTPFRSMVQYLLDSQEERDVVFFYTSSYEAELAYRDLFDKANALKKFKVIYVLTKADEAPKQWAGEVGRLDNEKIKKHVPDYQNRKYLLSGPHAMVEAYQQLLLNMGVSKKHLQTDYFPGF